MSSLETKFLNLTLPNPFILAAGPPTAKGELVVEAFRAGWGGAVLKTISLEPTPLPKPRLHVIKSGRDKRGMLDIELFSNLTVEHWEDEIDMIRASFPDRLLIASIAGGGSPHEWQEVIRLLEPHRVSGFEMNVSCPSFAGGKGEKLGQNPEALEKAVTWVREATKLPVIVKLTPNVTNINFFAKIAMDAGADAFTISNSLQGLGGIDLDSFSPLPSVDGIGIFGGYGGPGLKPVSLRCTANVAKNLPLPIIGCGGISNWRDAAEYLAAGASAVAICTAVMWNGIQIIDSLTKELENYLDRKRFTSPTDVTGKALPNIVTFPDLNLSFNLVASIVNEICNGCGICVKACTSGAYQAITVVDDLARVDLVKCSGCGLCMGVCPLNAVRMVQSVN
jgi:dihydropyrimidine dehydrogenase (NAD+) subunit PreA